VRGCQRYGAGVCSPSLLLHALLQHPHKAGMMYDGGDEEAYKVFSELSYEDKMTIMNEAFTYEVYGW